MKSRTQGNLKVEIDRDLCIGSASCVVLAPNTFVLDNEGKVDIIDGPWDDPDTVQMAADSCPVRAITVTYLQGQAGGAAQRSSDISDSSVISDDPDLNQEAVLEKLKTVLDPELGINVVDLGLVYGIQTQGSRVTVDMTLTTPGCPLITEFVKAAHDAVASIPGVEDADINLTFDPPWDPSRMNRDAAEELGFLF